MNLLEMNLPRDLKNMSLDDLELLAIEIRDFLITNVSKTGGHLASNLGAVELTIALHYYFDTPNDKIIWDVGHQTYVHKILTNRARDFKNLRQLGGMSGFPKTEVSEYDTYDTGHSSTSISLASGFAKARDLKGENHQVIAVIGDGALTGGLAYEGLNNLGAMKTKAIVILNDNGMSIGKNTGGLSKHLSRIRVSQKYASFKNNLSNTLKKIPVVGEGISYGANKLKDTIKYSIVDGIMFEKLGFTYLGPIDGHNIKEVVDNLKLANNATTPVILHVITKKGKGYKIAEDSPGKFHGIGPFDIETGQVLGKSRQKKYSNIFGDKLVELAEKDKKILAISAAMIDGTGLKKFSERFPTRIFDVGIAEEHATTFAGALAINGFKPVVAVYSTFLQRAYDQIIIDVCLQNLPVVFAIDRAGIVGEDGETHHGVLDISFLKSIPNLTILSPKDGDELEGMMEYAFELNSPVAIRYPRGEEMPFNLECKPLEEGAEILNEGSDIAIWAIGNMVSKGMKVVEYLKDKNISATLVNARFIAPVDHKKLLQTTENKRLLVTIEDNIVSGGFGESLNTILASSGIKTKVLNIGWDREFIEHGNSTALFHKNKLDAQGIYERICEVI